MEDMTETNGLDELIRIENGSVNTKYEACAIQEQVLRDNSNFSVCNENEQLFQQ